MQKYQRKEAARSKRVFKAGSLTLIVHCGSRRQSSEEESSESSQSLQLPKEFSFDLVARCMEQNHTEYMRFKSKIVMDHLSQEQYMGFLIEHAKDSVGMVFSKGFITKHNVCRESKVAIFNG